MRDELGDRAGLPVVCVEQVHRPTDHLRGPRHRHPGQGFEPRLVVGPVSRIAPLTHRPVDPVSVVQVRRLDEGVAHPSVRYDRLERPTRWRQIDLPVAWREDDHLRAGRLQSPGDIKSVTAATGAIPQREETLI